MLAPQHFAKQMDMDGGGGIHPARFIARRKRKADMQPENNERLSKRLSLLNLEQNGPMLYVHVENSLAEAAATSMPGFQTEPDTPQPPRMRKHRRPAAAAADDTMQVDDTKHKVYIYNLEDELSSESEPEDGADSKLVFLHDLEKHMRANRIPPHVLADARGDDDAAGRELVLYTVPKSLSVPQEQDSVRKAILEARARARTAQQTDVVEGFGDVAPVIPDLQAIVEDVDVVDPASVDMAPEVLGVQTVEDSIDGHADAMELD